MIQQAAAHLVFNEPKRVDIKPLFISLHCSQLLPSSSSRHWGLHTEKSLYLHHSNYTHLKM